MLLFEAHALFNGQKAVENPVYLYDIFAVNVLIAASFVAWLALYRRLPRMRKWWFASYIGALICSGSCLLLHLWAEIRPIPVFVRIRSLSDFFLKNVRFD
jgi:uncharacterized BrkB/YihY/UPF0761 family membrane protein